MPGVRSVAFGAWVRAASLHEPRERMGVSHLLEHMVFKGTRRAQREGDRARRSRRSAARSTRTRRASTPSIRRACSTSISTTRPTSSATSCFGRRCATATSRSSGRSCSRRSAWSRTRPTISSSSCTTRRCGAQHPYGYSILGTRETVSGARASTTCGRCTRAPTIPAQLVVAAAGNVEHDALLDIARANGLGGRAGGRRDADSSSPPPRRRGADVARHVTRDGAQTHIVVGSDGDSARRSAPLCRCCCSACCSAAA